MKPNTTTGKFIVFEGLDGSGQTTQAQLLARWFATKWEQLVYYTKEPSDGPIGAILKLVLAHRLVCNAEGKRGRPLDEASMALMFAADRADHIHNEVIPKLKEGVHVIADRYYLSSLAYQTIAVDFGWIKELNKHCLQPDLTLFLDVPPAVCVKRMLAQRWHIELYEDVRTLERIRNNYHDAITRLLSEGERIEIVDAHQPVKDVHKVVVGKVKDLLKSAPGARTMAPNQLELLLKSEPLDEKEIAAHQEG